MIPLRRQLPRLLALVLAGGALAAAAELPAGMVLVPAGDYEPVWRAAADPARIPVAPFWLDVQPVTNADFLAFVRANPQWQRSRVLPLFADEGYLGDWAGDLVLGPKAPADSPVVRVSWFAARAYAEWRGKRLPTTAEWERAAQAGFTTVRGADEPAYREAVFDWYAEPSPAVLPAAGAGRPNFFGVRDMLTLVWEWVEDFNSAMLTTDSRSDSGRAFFCSAAAVNAQDLTNYPAFMRAGFRSSLRASYVVPNLGFRCAESLPAATAGADGNLRKSL